MTFRNFRPSFPHRAIFYLGALAFLAGPLRAIDPAGITAADVAQARRAIFSPESGAVIPPDQAALLDTNHDGLVTLEDLNGLAKSHSKWKTLFVAPQAPANIPPGAALGSYANPFVLTEDSEDADGGFYDQVRKITFLADGGLGWNAEIVFLPGIYTRIQLLLRNADTTEEPSGSHEANYTKPIKAVIDRTHPVRLLLRSLDPLSGDPAKEARFFGGIATPAGDGAETTPSWVKGATAPAPDLKALSQYGPSIRLKKDALDGANPMFLIIQGANRVDARTEISGITVSGLEVSAYRSGIDLLFASRIVLKNNRLEMLGSARTADEAALSDNDTPAMYGTFAIGMARNCTDILIKNNRITTTWNRYNMAAPKGEGDPGLMHPFYIINAIDVVYLDNRCQDSSGPMLKLVDESIIGPEGTVTGSAMPHARQVLINNHFLESIDHLDGLYPAELSTLAMIHDNSSKVMPLPGGGFSQPTLPVSNMIFLGNTWEAKVKMDFLRRESVTTSRQGVSSLKSRFPNWIFAGNVWAGFVGGPNIVERSRGWDAINAKHDITQEVVTSPNETVRFDPVPQPMSFADAIVKLKQLVLGAPGAPATESSGNLKQDQLLVTIAETKEIPNVSTDK